MRQRSLVKTLIPAAALLSLAACQPPAPDAAPVRPVLVEHPQPMLGESSDVLPGVVHAREEADLAFRVPGKILARRVNAGDSVQAGQVLATLDAQDAQLNVDAARASVGAAEADAKLADAELQRYRDLLGKGFISQSAVDQRQNQADLAHAKLEQARANQAVVVNQSRYTSLLAPKAGLITAVIGEAGQVVGAGQPVFRFAAGSEREVLVHVPEGRVETLRKAEKLVVRLWARPDHLYAGRLREVNLQADPNTRMHDARVTIVDGGADIDLGTTAAVILGERVDPSLFLVPLSSIAGTQLQPGVWAVESGTTRLVPVQPVRYLETGAVVKGELTPQMTIVSAGAQLVVPGQKVEAVERQRPGQPS
ncbi:MAG: efflux RND transporter periplasmic adaptor subunit [Nevskiaceae bacterium]|nr:MAG: efflux RND transporter periplasmic adaptor subunit [Nevskiaceae bacterium]